MCSSYRRTKILKQSRSFTLQVRLYTYRVFVKFVVKAELIFRSWGGHLVGMTTVPEVVLAKEAGLMYAVIAMATDTGDNVSHNEVLRVFQVDCAGKL